MISERDREKNSIPPFQTYFLKRLLQQTIKTERKEKAIIERKIKFFIRIRFL